jgi:hypothetical protein
MFDSWQRQLSGALRKTSFPRPCAREENASTVEGESIPEEATHGRLSILTLYEQTVGRLQNARADAGWIMMAAKPQSSFEIMEGYLGTALGFSTGVAGTRSELDCQLNQVDFC